MDTYVREVPKNLALAFWSTEGIVSVAEAQAQAGAGAGAGASLHSDHVKTRISELVQDLDGVALGANRADLIARIGD